MFRRFHVSLRIPLGTFFTGGVSYVPGHTSSTGIYIFLLHDFYDARVHPLYGHLLVGSRLFKRLIADDPRETKQYRLRSERTRPRCKRPLPRRVDAVLGVLCVRGVCGRVLSRAGYASWNPHRQRASCNALCSIPRTSKRVRGGIALDRCILRSTCRPFSELSDALFLGNHDCTVPRWTNGGCGTTGTKSSTCMRSQCARYISRRAGTLSALPFYLRRSLIKGGAVYIDQLLPTATTTRFILLEVNPLRIRSERGLFFWVVARIKLSWWSWIYGSSSDVLCL